MLVAVIMKYKNFYYCLLAQHYELFVCGKEEFTPCNAKQFSTTSLPMPVIQMDGGNHVLLL
jgi:hypothetical protein